MWPVAENEIPTQGNQPVGPAGTLGTGASPSTPPSFGARSQGQPDRTKLKTCDKFRWLAAS